MATTLPAQTHEHHERIMSYVDRMPALGDGIGHARDRTARDQLNELVTFLTGTLLPHVDTAEQTLYPELERLQQNAHSMTPMRGEHAQIRHPVDDLAACAARSAWGHRRRDTRRAATIRVRVYALLEVDLAEEELYTHIVERGVSTDAASATAAAMDHPVVATAYRRPPQGLVPVSRKSG